jgi:hypothetical protein
MIGGMADGHMGWTREMVVRVVRRGIDHDCLSGLTG